MRTQDELAQKMRQSDSLLGFEKEVFLRYLDFTHAKEFLKPELIKNEPEAEAEWNQEQMKLQDNVIRADMAEYMYEYGWDKAKNHRGISAGRTVEKMTAWLWLLADDQTIKEVEEASYQNYGCPKLAVICKKYQLNIPDDPAIQLMIQGKHCGANYECGCDS